MDNSILLYEERDELIKSLLNVRDIELIKKIRSILSNEAKLPAVMTVEELKIEVMEAVKEIENGEVVSHEELLADLGL
jgi:poly-gamma-glutamate capsule biosynthesis protein CapA/YwtB (metallophosphatase superfamily)